MDKNGVIQVRVPAATAFRANSLFTNALRAVAISLLLLPIAGRAASPSDSLPQKKRSKSSAIIGRVVDASTHKPLSEVEVYVDRLRRGDVSDKHGRFRIAGVPIGNWETIFKRQGYKTRFEKSPVVDVGETIELNVAMTPAAILLEEVQVTANRSPALGQRVSPLVTVITAQTIRERSLTQTPEALREQTGVFVQKTNQGGGSPIIRGFKANKLLLMVDGIRLNNATYRGGNLQYLNTVDAFALERVEIVHGPTSALYGSDALGGAINVITRKPLLIDTVGHEWHGSFSGLISTADQTRTSHLVQSNPNITRELLCSMLLR